MSKPSDARRARGKQVANLSAELTFEQQQEITGILESYRANPSNSNKYRYHLFAYIDGLLQQQVIDLPTEDSEPIDGHSEAQPQSTIDAEREQLKNKKESL